MKKSRILGLLIVLIVAAAMLVGCVALKEKTVALESKVYGIDLQVPNLNSSSSIACLKLGVIITRFADAPEGGEVDMSTTYNDISFWSGTGSGSTTFKIKGPSRLTESDVVDSGISTDTATTTATAANQ